MKFAYALSINAAALALIAGLSAVPANATGHSRWCLHNPSVAQMNCIYPTKSDCMKFVHSGTESCRLNKKP